MGDDLLQVFSILDVDVSSIFFFTMTNNLTVNFFVPNSWLVFHTTSLDVIATSRIIKQMLMNATNQIYLKNFAIKSTSKSSFDNM